MLESTSLSPRSRKPARLLLVLLDPLREELGRRPVRHEGDAEGVEAVEVGRALLSEALHEVGDVAGQAGGEVLLLGQQVREHVADRPALALRGRVPFRIVVGPSPQVVGEASRLPVPHGVGVDPNEVRVIRHALILLRPPSVCSPELLRSGPPPWATILRREDG